MVLSVLRTILAAVAVLVFAAAVPAAAQQQAAEGEASNQIHETAPVAIDGATIFELRGASAYPAALRAATVSKRIEAIAADPSISPDSITIESLPLGFQISAGPRLIFTVVDADAEMEGLEPELLAEVMRTRIRQSIVTYRTERSPEVLKKRAIYAAAALATTILSIVGFLLVTRWLLKVVNRRYKHFIEGVKIQSFRLVRAEQIYAVLRGFIQLLRTAICLAIVYLCAVYVLGLFPWTRPVSTGLLVHVINPLEITLAAILDNIPNLIFIAIIFVLTRVVLRLTHVLFRAIEFKFVTFGGFEPEWARPTYKLVRLAIIAFAIVVAYPYIPGSSSAAFKGVSIFAGIIFSLGSSSIISNIVAGYSMIYRRAYEVGDWIQVGNAVGEVMDLRLLVTHLRSSKNEAIVLPNSTVMSSEVVNFSTLADKRGLLLHPTVGIGYEVPWRQVEAMLIEAAGRTKGLRDEPAPFVLEKSLGDFAVTYELNVGCDDPRRMPQLYAALYCNILDVFNENGVQIMTPNYEADPETPKLVAAAQWLEPLAVSGRDKASGEAASKA